jgi:uncharacterized protein (AIM24 family)
LGAPGGAPPDTQSQSAEINAQHNKPYTQYAWGRYRVLFGNTNTLLDLQLNPGATIKAKSGSMIHMSGTVQLSGKIKFSMKKLLTGGELSESTFTGPGQVCLGPTLFGDIITLQITGQTRWVIGKDAFLASTPTVTKDTKAQGFSKAMFSGEDLFVYTLGGQGTAWLTSFGAVDLIKVRSYFPRHFPVLRRLGLFVDRFFIFSYNRVNSTLSITVISSRGPATTVSKEWAAP